MSFPISFSWRVILFFLATLLPTLSQVSASLQPVQQTQGSGASLAVTQYQQQMAALWQQRQVLMNARNTLLANGATADQMKSWQQQYGTHLLAIDLQARGLAASLPMPTIIPFNAPADVSAEEKEFLQNQATLANSFAQLHNHASASAAPSTSAAAVQTSSTTPSPDDAVAQQWEQVNEALIARQSQLSAEITNNRAQQTILLPPPLALPQGLAPQLQAYLTARDQLKRAEIQALNKYCTMGDPNLRAAAFQQWQQSNVSLYAHLQELAQALSQTAQN